MKIMDELLTSRYALCRTVARCTRQNDWSVERAYRVYGVRVAELLDIFDARANGGWMLRVWHRPRKDRQTFSQKRIYQCFEACDASEKMLDEDLRQAFHTANCGGLWFFTIWLQMRTVV